MFLVCADCTQAEFDKVQVAEVLVDQTFRKDCFLREMEKRGVSFGDATVVRTVTGTFDMHFYYRDDHVIGWMTPGQPDIWMNRKFHDTYGACETSSNIAHELCHMQGFRHAKADVCYATNAAFSACCVEPK